VAWIWLIAAGMAGAGAYLSGWPAWAAYRVRRVRDLNAERYLAWRGRADRNAPAREGPTPEERRRLWLAAGLAVAAAICLVAFFATT
jgi:hypothetical protein